MSSLRTILRKLLSGTSDASLRFDEVVRLLKAVGFQERIRGSHHIFTRAGIPEILNLQPRGQQAKPYQVKQVREVIVREQLGTVIEGDQDNESGGAGG
jgi:HicA toxin of bacterial toxin-antitoxin,